MFGMTSTMQQFKQSWPACFMCKQAVENFKTAWKTGGWQINKLLAGLACNLFSSADEVPTRYCGKAAFEAAPPTEMHIT